MRIIAFILLSMIGAMASGQGPHPILKNFFAQQQGEEVYLQWTIDKGQTCNDIIIERSGNSKSFEKIGFIAGVCGSPDQEMVYRFTDTIPLKNMENHYRLELGSQGYSEFVSVKTIITGNEGYHLVQNPIKSNLRIYFEDEGQKTMHVFDLNGKQHFTRSFSGQEFSESLHALPSGIYIFRVETEDRNMIRGKFVIAK